MTCVKICGLMRKEDIEYVNLLRPDYIGLVFAKSRRQITVEWAAELISNLKEGIVKVGVFQNMPKDNVQVIANSCQLDVLQFHGDEDMNYCYTFQKKGWEVWKAFSIKNKQSFEHIKDYDIDGYLLDTYTKEQCGGSGKTFNWELIQAMNEDGVRQRLIVAGGLNSENVNEAIKVIKPHIVDVSSGIETGGIKDFTKMKAFIDKVRTGL